MSFESYVAYGLGAVVIIVVISTIAWLVPKRIRHDKMAARWKKLQQRCSDETQWKQAVTEADDMLEDVLKKKKIKGSGTGERIVSAQKIFTNNDGVWYGHKMRTRIDTVPELKLTRDEVQKALIGIRQALKDLGAMK